MNALHDWEAPPLPFRREEILRYAGMKPGNPAPEALPLEECLREAGLLPPCRGVWRRIAITEVPEGLDLGFTRTESLSLRRFLKGCGGAVLMAVTAGTAMERLIARNQARSAVRGWICHAIGNERVETACDALQAELEARLPGWRITGRFSPGYGDLPLAMQRDIFRALDCERRLGLTLTEELLMIPRKSVTALAGLRREESNGENIR